jgi:hypothetical protein
MLSGCKNSQHSLTLVVKLELGRRAGRCPATKVGKSLIWIAAFGQLSNAFAEIMAIMGNTDMNAEQPNNESRPWYEYEGPLGEVVHNGRYFFAWKEGRRIGTYDTFEEAMTSLQEKERLKTP